MEASKISSVLGNRHQSNSMVKSMSQNPRLETPGVVEEESYTDEEIYQNNSAKQAKEGEDVLTSSNRGGSGSSVLHSSYNNKGKAQ